MPKLKGKIAAVTSGSSSMGLGTANHFVEEDAFADTLDKAVSPIGDSAASVQGDYPTSVILIRSTLRRPPGSILGLVSAPRALRLIQK